MKTGRLGIRGIGSVSKIPTITVRVFIKFLKFILRFVISGKKGLHNVKVATYKEIHVLDEGDPKFIDEIFHNEIIKIRDLLAQTSKRNGTLIDVDNNFDGEASGQSRFNIKFRLEDETYLFPEDQNFKIERGGI